MPPWQTKKKIALIASPLSLTTIDHVLNKYETSASVLNKLRKFKIICEICEVNEETIDKALNSKFKDFEDAVHYFSALQSKSSLILTRNAKDFKHATIPIMTAEAYLSSIL